MCEYAFYKDKERIYPKLYCKLNNKACIYSKFCTKINKYIPREGMENCYMLTQKKNDIPQGAYHVRFIDKGYLYIDIEEDRVIKIKNTLEGVTNYIYLKKNDCGYDISLTPFTNETKKKSSRKKTNV